jgi:hypothetical protein
MTHLDVDVASLVDEAWVQWSVAPIVGCALPTDRAAAVAPRQEVDERFRVIVGPDDVIATRWREHQQVTSPQLDPHVTISNSSPSRSDR